MSGAGPRRFAILEHEWAGVHWDILLESGDALRTWAVDAPIVPGVDLPARPLPDHRPAYLDYEGPISGNRGTVRRVASGTFLAMEWGDRLVRVELAGDQLAGRAEFRASGPIGPWTRWTFRLGNRD